MNCNPCGGVFVLRRGVRGVRYGVVLQACLLAGVIAITAHAQDVVISGAVTPSPASSPTWIIPDTLWVGSFQAGGEMHISGSGSVSNTSAQIGTFFHLGQVTVSGGTWTNSGDLQVYGSGTLTPNLVISGTGAVSNQNADVGGNDKTAIVLVSGGTWTNHGRLAIQQVSRLTITGGAVTSATATFGGSTSLPGNQATVEVSGGSWNNSGEFHVGHFASGFGGRLELSGTGFVSSGVGFIGTGGRGSAAVTGGAWANAGALVVGNDGNGTLEISGTGAVSNTVGYIGTGSQYFFGSVGSASVSGGTWTNSSELYVGYGTTGSLSISGTGDVAATLVEIGSDATHGNGALSLLGGTLTTGQVSKGLGVGTVTFNGGTLRLSGNQGELFSNFQSGNVTLVGAGGTIDTQDFAVATDHSLSGNGLLRKMGNGSLTLSGVSSYSGGTIVEEGRLVVTDVGDAESVLGSGSVSVQSLGTLGGVGTILGDTTLAGTLAPGHTSPGQLHFAEALLMTPFAVAHFDLASLTIHSSVEVDGLLTYDGTLSLSLLNNYLPQVGDTFQLFEAANVFGGSQFDTVVFGVSGYDGVFDYDTGLLTITAVPEPTGMALLLVAGILAFLFRLTPRRP